MAYTGLRPQEALGLHWYAVRGRALLVEHANADGELEPLKNRERARKLDELELRLASKRLGMALPPLGAGLELRTPRFSGMPTALEGGDSSG